MTINVSPSTKNPTHHIKLSDGVDEVGLILCNADGQANPFAIQRVPYPRTALKTYTGQGAYDDEEPPFNTVAQEDFSGGRGKLVFDEDETRYYDGKRVDTTDASRVILGPQEHYSSGYRDLDQEMPGDVYFGDTWSATLYRSVMFTASASYNAIYIELWLKYRGSAGTLTVSIYSDDGSDKPNVALQSATVTTSSFEENIARLHRFTITTQALVSGTKYHVVVKGAAGDDVTNHWLTGCSKDDGYTTYASTDGSTWNVTSAGPWFRVLDAGSDMAGLFFEYKRALYFISQEDDATNSTLYLNGDRGVADSNALNLDTLIDASKTWTADEWIGCVVLVTAGPGAEENQPWRTITDNDATTLTVDTDWTVQHTTETEYVILGSTKWTSVQDIGAFCTDVAVADDFVYFARGDTGSSNVLRYQWYNNSGTATTRNDAENDAARYLIPYRDASSGEMFIYGANNKRGSPWFRTVTLWRGQVPKAWGDLYYDLGQVVPTDEPWDEGTTAITDVTAGTQDNMTKIDIAAGFGTGVAAMEDIAATDITAGKAFGVMIKSSVTTASGDIQFQRSDTASLGGTVASVDIPALTANEWTWVAIDISPLQHTAPDDTAIISFGLNVVTDNGAQVIYMYGGIRLLADRIEYFDFPTEAQINNLLKYAGGVSDDVRENPWILTENQAYEFQTQSGDAIVPLALGEIASLRSEDNGVGACVNGVYLWFNLGEKIERYYNRQLDDIGPDRDEGLPDDRRGVPRYMLSYPGRVYAAIDGGSDNYSSIVAYENSGWHEIYRAPRAGVQIRGLYAQSIPGLIDRIWICQGDDIIYIPVSLNPTSDTSYTYTHQGILETGRYYVNRRDISKFWHSLKLATENLDDTVFERVRIRIDYRTDNSSTWTEVSDIYDTSPFQEVDITSDNSLASKWIQFRLRIETELNSISPELISMIIESLMVVPVKYTYQLTFRAVDYDNDLNGDPDNVGADEKIAILDGWVSSSILPITMNSISSLEDSKTVYPQPIPVRKVKKIIDEDREGYVCQVNFIGI